MYYEVYLDFNFLESFLTDVALLILVKTVMREKWKAKRIAGTDVLESMWSCIELLLPFRGSFTATFFWIVLTRFMHRQRFCPLHCNKEIKQASSMVQMLLLTLSSS